MAHMSRWWLSHGSEPSKIGGEVSLSAGVVNWLHNAVDLDGNLDWLQEIEVLNNLTSIQVNAFHALWESHHSQVFHGQSSTSPIDTKGYVTETATERSCRVEIWNSS